MTDVSGNSCLFTPGQKKIPIAVSLTGFSQDISAIFAYNYNGYGYLQIRSVTAWNSSDYTLLSNVSFEAWVLWIEVP